MRQQKWGLVQGSDHSVEDSDDLVEGSDHGAAVPPREVCLAPVAAVGARSRAGVETWGRGMLAVTHVIL